MRKVVVWGSVLIGLSLLVLFRINDRVRETEQQIASMVRELQEERESIHMLKAEWGYLTRPERLVQYVQYDHYLQPMTRETLASAVDIPEVPYVPIPVMGKPFAPGVQGESVPLIMVSSSR